MADRPFSRWKGAEGMLVKELADFQFGEMLINEALVRELATGAFLAEQRNTVLQSSLGEGL